MRRFSLANLLTLVMVAGILFALIGPNFRKSERFNSRAETEATLRRSKIEQEVAQLSNRTWAGSYYHGDGRGVNVNLSLAPNSGFVFEWHGCLGTYDRNYGPVQEANGQVKLLPQFPNKQEGFQGIATQFLPVAWGKRHYLVPPNEMIEFCNAVNSGMVRSFLLRQGDEKLPVVGQPEVPDQYRAYLLGQPINASAIAVNNATRKNGDIGSRKLMLTLDVGSDDGVLAAMEFHVIEPTESFGSVTIEQVEKHTSVASFLFVLDDDPPPVIGWKFSTRYRFATDQTSETVTESP